MRKLLVALAITLSIVAVGVAYATIPDSAGVIHGCYKTADGKLRVVDSATQTCASGESSLNWNQAGPPGPQGPPGTPAVQSTVTSSDEFAATGTVIADIAPDSTGEYLAFATFVVDNVGPSEAAVRCRFIVPDDIVPVTSEAVAEVPVDGTGNGGAGVTLALSSELHLTHGYPAPSGHLELLCKSSSSGVSAYNDPPAQTYGLMHAIFVG